MGLAKSAASCYWVRRIGVANAGSSKTESWRAGAEWSRHSRHDLAFWPGCAAVGRPAAVRYGSQATQMLCHKQLGSYVAGATQALSLSHHSMSAHLHSYKQDWGESKSACSDVCSAEESDLQSARTRVFGALSATLSIREH